MKEQYILDKNEIPVCMISQIGACNPIDVFIPVLICIFIMFFVASYLIMKTSFAIK